MSPLSSQKILEVLNDPRLELKAGSFSEEAVERIHKYFGVLQKWNDKINLTSEKDAETILEKHLFDSLHYLRWLNPAPNERPGLGILDIGSGAGFPGIPIQILHPEFELTLLESQRKRCNFLREAVRELKLTGVSVIEGRAEKISGRAELAGSFDRVLFRGFASLDICLAVGLPFLKEGGQIIMMKSPDELPTAGAESLQGARIADSQPVEKYNGMSSLMMVVEKCST